MRNVSKYGLIYAGARKPRAAGVTLVILRRDLLDRPPQGLPAMLDYRPAGREQSLTTRPPASRSTWWAWSSIGCAPRRRRDRAAQRGRRVLYRAIDQSAALSTATPAREPLADERHLSLPSEELESAFAKERPPRALDGPEGAPPVGGLRASLYNALPPAAVEALVQFMAEFREEI